MAIIGEILKKTIEIADKIFTNPDPKEAQQDVLKQLLEKAENTAFGKFYQFKHLLAADDDLRHVFSEAVPYHSYDNMLDRWWYKVLEGGEDVTWPGKVKYFAVSSGTTSSKKYIPVTDEMLKSFRVRECSKSKVWQIIVYLLSSLKKSCYSLAAVPT